MSDPTEAEQPKQVHREACEECHHRKIRCVTERGACQNCIQFGRSCTYSPRVPMGRPRKRKAESTSKGSGQPNQSKSTSSEMGESIKIEPRRMTSASVYDALASRPPFADSLPLDEDVRHKEYTNLHSSSSSLTSNFTASTYDLDLLQTPVDEPNLNPVVFDPFGPSCGSTQFSDPNVGSAEDADLMVMSDLSRPPNPCLYNATNLASSNSVPLSPSGISRHNSFHQQTPSSYSPLQGQQWSPVQQPKQPTNSPDPDCLDNSITLLPSLLFEMRYHQATVQRSMSNPSILHTSYATFPSQLLTAITNGLNVAQACLHSCNDSRMNTDANGNLYSTVCLLILIASNIIQTLSLLSQNKGQLLHTNAVSPGAAGNPHNALNAFSFSETKSHQRLDLILTVTTIDYLLARCQRLLVQLSRLCTIGHGGEGMETEINKWLSSVATQKSEVAALVESLKGE